MVTIITQHGQELEAADPGMSGIKCGECHAPFTAEEYNKALGGANFDELQCTNCKEITYSVDSFDVVVSPESIPMVEDENVRTATWFHATTVENWHEVVSGEGDPDMNWEDHTGKGDTTIMVHIGSKAAAEDRARVDFYDEEWFLHEITLNDGVEIAPVIMPDEETKVPERAYQCEGRDYSAAGVTRYLNAYESPGSISLLVNPHAITVVKTHVKSGK